jgi:hypothetical protein
MIITVGGELPLERHTPAWSLQWPVPPVCSGMPLQTTPPQQDNQHTTSTSPQAKHSDHHG